MDWLHWPYFSLQQLSCYSLESHATKFLIRIMKINSYSLALLLPVFFLIQASIWLYRSLGLWHCFKNKVVVSLFKATQVLPYTHAYAYSSLFAKWRKLWIGTSKGWCDLKLKVRLKPWKGSTRLTRVIAVAVLILRQMRNSSTKIIYILMESLFKGINYRISRIKINRQFSGEICVK